MMDEDGYRQVSTTPAFRICIVGDESVGKSSLLNSLVRETFTTNIQAVLPPITIPPNLSTPENVTTTIFDTSALPQERNSLKKEVRKCNVLLLVYSDHYSYERVALFWMPLFRSLGVNVPVVLCANKSDLAPQGTTTAQVVEDELLPVMAEFKEIDSCIRTSAREHHNVNEVFFLCQKAVTHPVAPLYDAKERCLKPAAVEALKRVFYLCDRDGDGILNDKETHDFQMKCFEKPLTEGDLASIKRTIQRWTPDGKVQEGIDIEGFLLLNRMFAEKGRHETIWIILRKFHYTDSLSLKDSFVHPKFDVPAFASAELSPAGYRFFVDLFLLHDKDKDGGLNDKELAALFAPTPGLPTSWVESAFPNCTVRNEAGYITLQGWLAQWSMTTFESPKTTLEYLAYLGFEAADGKSHTTSALKVTKARKRRGKPSSGKVERNVFLCYVLGAPGSGKSALLNSFLNRPFSPTYHPTIQPQTAVNSVELQGGKQCYLILSELGELEPAILENQRKLDACDLICYTYDSSDPDSFTYLADLRQKHPALHSLPAVYTALKADRDRAVQRTETQPDAYCESLKMGKPMHVSVNWGSVSEFFVHLAESATMPAQAFPKGEDEDVDRMGWYMAVGAVVAVGVAGIWVWRRSGNGG